MTLETDVRTDGRTTGRTGVSQYPRFLSEKHGIMNFHQSGKIIASL